jgi:hypothetical protein
MNQPLVLDADRTIIVGHTRYRALRELGNVESPCVIADLPADKVKEYRIADNASADIAEWDYAALIPELREVGSIEDFAVHFPSMDLDSLLKSTAGVIEFDAVTQEQIDKHSGKLAADFDNKHESHLGDIVTLTCPHCGEDMEVSKTDIAKSKAG